MLLRFIADNFLSFKDATEFNTFQSSKSIRHENHKISCGHTVALRFSAIYGANGAGKSNLLKAIMLLKSIVMAETLNDIRQFDGLYFKLCPDNESKPIGMAVEFFYNGNIYYYHLEFMGRKVIHEELLLSQKKKDVEIYSRQGNRINIARDFFDNGYIPQFTDVLERIVRDDMVLLSFLGKYYAKELPVVGDAYYWMTEVLEIVMPNLSTGVVPHMLDKNSSFAELVNRILPELKTGLKRIDVTRRLISEDNFKGDEEMMELISQAKETPGVPSVRIDSVTNEISNIVYEDGALYLKSLVAVHDCDGSGEISMNISNESDGTRRMIEYMPLFYSMSRTNRVFVVDEIERSLHPILIKEIIVKLSKDPASLSQLIFTTHESCLLDQDIFRPDEIWFAQKDVEQSTKLYPLSDFNIHSTANIENGYLNGRYGGIPFLSNLKDLHW